MNRYGISLLMGVLLAVSGCIFDSDNDDGDDRLPDVRNSLGIGSVAAVYYPMVPGSVWNYNRTVSNTIEGQATTFSNTNTRQCKSKYTMDGTTYFRVDDSLYEEATYWYDGNNVNFISPILVSKTATHHGLENVERIQKIAAPIHDPEMDMLRYRFNVSEGTTWPIREYHWTPEEYYIELGYYKPDEYFDVVITGKYLGVETITTGMGTFEDCVKMQQTISDTFRETAQDGSSYDGSATTITYIWFAPEIGVVKEYEYFTDTRGNISRTETALTSYDIPGSGTGVPADHCMEGKVVDWDGAGIAGITVTVTGEGKIITGATDENGEFSIGSLTQGYYEVTPSQNGMDITPAIATANIVESDTYVGTFLGGTATATPMIPPYPVETYLQFHEGAIWTYAETDFDSMGEPREPRQVVYTCKGEVLHEESGERYIELDPSYDDREYYAIDGNDVYSYESGMWVLGFVGKPAVTLAHGGIEDAFDFETSEMLSYTFDKPAGTAWRVTEASSTRDSSYVNVCYSGRYAGLETVETGADVFENCARFEFSLQAGYEADNHKGGDMFYVSGSETMILTRWFAPDVGMVKQTVVRFKDGDNRQDDGSYVFEAGEFRFESELTLLEYSIH